MSLAPESAVDLHFMTAVDLAALTRARKIGCLDLLDHHIERIERLDGLTNAVVVRDFDRARRRARALDQTSGQTPSLFGVPMTIKESFDVEGLPTTWGDERFRNSIAATNALAVDRLIEAGAVILGKTNVPVMLTDYQSYNPIYGTTNHPWDLALSPGGSSGGAAAALAVGYCALEVGSDVGSSIRNPAHYCGVFGHKPTWGICPPLGHGLGGAVAAADISVIGPMARSAGDLMTVLDVMAGPEAIDAGWKLDLPPPRMTGFRGLRVAVMTDHPLSEVDTSIVSALHELSSFLVREGAIVSFEARPDFDLTLGHSLYIQMLRATTSTRIDPAAAAKAGREAANLSGDDHSYYADALRGQCMAHRDFLLANETRHRMRRAWSRFFSEWDLLLCPPAASPAQKHDQCGERWQRSIEVNDHAVPQTDQMFWAGIAGLYLLPASVAPLGVTSNGLPIGVQIIGAQYADKTTIAFAGLLEKSWRRFAAPPRWLSS
jgi:amidase